MRFFSHKIVPNANYYIVSEIDQLLHGNGVSKEGDKGPQGQKQTCRGDTYFHYLNCGNIFLRDDVKTFQIIFIKRSVYVNYPAMKNIFK